MSEKTKRRAGKRRGTKRRDGKSGRGGLRRDGVIAVLAAVAAIGGGVAGLRLGAGPGPAASPQPAIQATIQAVPMRETATVDAGSIPTPAPIPALPPRSPSARETKPESRPVAALPAFEENIATPAVIVDDAPPKADASGGDLRRAITEATARIAPPAPPSATSEPPPWRRYAVAVDPSALDGRPMIAMVIDDLGPPHARTERVIELPGPLTLAFLPYAEHLAVDTARARQNGHELLVHLPLEPLSAKEDPGPGAILTGLREDQLRAQLARNLGRFAGYVGVNNHMGSRFSQDAASMAILLAELRDRGLLYLDSVTVAGSLGLPIARALGVPSTRRNVFIDNDIDVEAITARLAEVEALARKRGFAVAIGHPHDATIEALAAWLPGLAARGFALVPISAIVAREEGVKIAVRETSEPTAQKITARETMPR